MPARCRLPLYVILCVCPVLALSRAEGTDIPSEEITLATPKGAPERSYFFMGPKQDTGKPEKGYGLLLVLPGGDGGRGFHPFVTRIYQNVTGPDWVAAQLIAVRWNKSKTIVWPTLKTPGRGAVPATERFVEDVITDVAGRVKLDPARIFLLAWSSGGPAAYAASLQKYTSVTGSYIAMSVFKPETLPPLREAQGAAYVIDHSPGDTVCPHWMATKAQELLTKAGAKVLSLTYEGGHGWHGNVYGRLRQGMTWLAKNHGPPDTRIWKARMRLLERRNR
jgi:predicted esterase